jgi:hypothetical protein
MGRIDQRKCLLRRKFLSTKLALNLRSGLIASEPLVATSLSQHSKSASASLCDELIWSTRFGDDEPYPA